MVGMLEKELATLHAAEGPNFNLAITDPLHVESSSGRLKGISKKERELHNEGVNSVSLSVEREIVYHQ